MTAVSVLLRTFNRPKWLVECVDSILAQDCDLELLVLDNGSGPETEAALRQYDTDPRVRRFRVETNGDEPDTYSSLAAHAQGRYLQIFCDDDRMLPGHLQPKVEMMDATETVAVYSPAEAIDEDGALLGFQVGNSGATTFDQVIIASCIPWQGLLFRKVDQDLLTVPGDPTVYGDWEIILALCRRGDLGFLPTPTTQLRVHLRSNSTIHGVVQGRFLVDGMKVWQKWLSRGWEPTVPQWDEMYKSWLLLSHKQFLQFRGGTMTPSAYQMVQGGER